MKTFLFVLFLLVSKAVTAGSTTVYIEHKVPVGSYNMYAKEYPGNEPTLILLHGYPDNHTLYDSLLPHLEGRHVIVFDFMGWGGSDKPKPKLYHYSAEQQELEIDAVVNYFQLHSVILVPHDMSGPAAINWSLDHKDKVAGLVILNTFYHKTKNRKLPFTGVLLQTPIVRNFIILTSLPNFSFNTVLKLTLKDFFVKKENREAFVPGFIKPFKGYAAKRAFFRTVSTKKIAKKDLARLEELKQFGKPVSIIFGSGDKLLGEKMANEFHELFKGSELHLIASAKHYPQIDAAKEVGELMMQFVNKNTSSLK